MAERGSSNPVQRPPVRDSRKVSGKWFIWWRPHWDRLKRTLNLRWGLKASAWQKWKKQSYAAADDCFSQVLSTPRAGFLFSFLCISSAERTTAVFVRSEGDRNTLSEFLCVVQLLWTLGVDRVSSSADDKPQEFWEKSRFIIVVSNTQLQAVTSSLHIWSCLYQFPWFN